LDVWVLRYASGQTDRHTDRHSNRNTAGGEVTKISEIAYCDWK